MIEPSWHYPNSDFEEEVIRLLKESGIEPDSYILDDIALILLKRFTR